MEVAIHRTGKPFLPRVSEWVIAYWPHMDRESKSKGVQLAGGWYRTRLQPRGWQAQFGSYRTYMAPQAVPQYWTPILPPFTQADHFAKAPRDSTEVVR